MKMSIVATHIPRKVGRPPKLKDCCDACAKSKVKCIREKPQECIRCFSNGIRCHFSVSRRMGKHRAPPLNPQSPRSSVGHRTSCDDDQRDNILPTKGRSSPGVSSNASSPRNGLSSSISSQSGPSTPNDDIIQDHVIREDDLSVVSGAFNSEIGSFLDDSLFSSPNLFDHVPIAENIFDGKAQTSTISLEHLSPEASPAVSGTVTSQSSKQRFQADTFPQEKHSRGNGALLFDSSPINICHSGCDSNDDCIGLALTTLSNLHAPFPACKSSAQKTVAARTIDSVLTTNKAALENISRILKCSCIPDPQIDVYLGLILSRVLAWYRAILYGCTAPDTPTTKTNSDACTERVHYLPVMLGAFAMDPQHYGKIILHLVSGELQMVSWFVDVVFGESCQKFDQTDITTNDASVWPLATIVRTELKTVLEMAEQLG